VGEMGAAQRETAFTYPFVTRTYRRLADEIFSILRDFGELDEGLEYVGNVIESI
jgi:hypothetical protein